MGENKYKVNIIKAVKMENISLLNKLYQAEKLAKLPRLKRLKKIPFKSFFLSFIFRVWYLLIQKGFLVKARTFWGDFLTVNLPAGGDLFLFGIRSHPSEIKLIKFLIKNVNEGNIVFDVGANIGFYSKLSSFLVKEKGAVHCFEPSPQNFSILHLNTKNAKNIFVNNLAVGEKNDILSFFEFPPKYSENNTFNPDSFSKQKWFSNISVKEVKVKVESLDNYCEKLKTYPDFIKIDVEGFESSVVLGMKKILGKKRVIVIMEYWSSSLFDNSSHRKAIEKILESGYKMYLINDDGDLILSKNYQDIEKKCIEKNLEFDNIVFKV